MQKTERPILTGYNVAAAVVYIGIYTYLYTYIETGRRGGITLRLWVACDTMYLNQSQ